MNSREFILSRVRAALGRGAADPVPEPPPVLLRFASSPPPDRAEKFRSALEALGGKVAIVNTPGEAGAYVESALAGRRAIASQAPILEACGIDSLPSVTTEHSRQACAAADASITSAEYALAETGTLVVSAGLRDSRMVSLLPPCHIAVIERSKILENLDELLDVCRQPAAQSSAVVLITGPSRTAAGCRPTARGPRWTAAG